MKISDLVFKDTISANLKSRTKEGALAEITEHLYKTRKIKDKILVLESLLKREKLGTTALGGGVAIPHARIAELKEAIVFVGASRHGIKFSSVDKKDVRLIILFLTPLLESELHLKILSKIAVILNNKVLVSRLISAPSADEIYRVMQQGGAEKEGFLSLAKDEIYLELATGDSGISEFSAKKRLEVYGPNELKALRKTPLIVKFAAGLTNLLAVLMWAGSALSFWAGMNHAGWAIIAVIFVNAAFGFWQEFKAEKAIEALKRLIPSFTRVIREGVEKKVSSRDIVSGDIIIVEEGDNVPADARLIESEELRVNNSAFSGESKLSHKMSAGFETARDFLWLEMPNLIFAGTSVATGRGKAVVIATGMSTEIGKIAYLAQTVKMELSPLQKEVNRLSKIIAAISVVMGLVFFFVGLTFTKMNFAAAAMFAIGIILANVPQGLMPTLSLALAMATRRMAKRNALIKKLSSVETLGCTNVICTDKTGTITANEMRVKRTWLGGNSLELLIRTGVLCNTAKLVPLGDDKKHWNVIGDPTEGALLEFARKNGIDDEKERAEFSLLKRFPFDSIRKRMSTVNRLPDGSARVFVKGAPKELLDLSTKIILEDKIMELDSAKKTEIIGKMDGFAAEGLRVLAFAYRSFDREDAASVTAVEVEKDLIFIGLAAMYDPPRPEVKDAIAVCKKAGIRVVMITGDYQLTALSIAREVGIVSSPDAEVITGAELSEMSDEKLKSKLEEKEVVFARVNPEHKLRVVNAFKDFGNIVAVTGDGVNDAPALKRADIGVAMGLRGTDVAKASAEMIIVDDNFASIVSAIEEGRAVFENIKKFITYIFAHLVPEAVPFILYAIFNLPVPITVMQILAIDLGTETLPALALGIEKPEPGIMEMPPRPKTKGVIDRTVLFRGYIFLGLLNAAAVVGIYYFVLYVGGWRPGVQLEPSDTVFADPLHLKAMTVVFAGIVVMQIANVFQCRSEKHSAFKMGFFDNKLILWGIGFELLFTAVLIYTPFFQKIFSTTAIGWQEWGILTVFMLIIFFLEELRKKLCRPKKSVFEEVSSKFSNEAKRKKITLASLLKDLSKSRQ